MPISLPRRLGLGIRVALPLLAASVAARAQDGVGPLTRGREALQRHELAVAESAFVVAARDTDQRVRAVAERSLGVAQWRYHGDFEAAERHLRLALVSGPDSAHTLVELARLEVARRHYQDAIAYAIRAERGATSDDIHRMAVRQMAIAVVEARLAGSVDGATVAAAERPDTSGARAAVGALEPIVTAVQGRTDESRLLVEVALLAGDGPTALQGWRSYYAVGADVSPTGLLAGPRRVLSELLPRWPSGVTRAERDQVVRALGDSRLFDAAALAVFGPVSQPSTPADWSPRARELVAYDAFCRRVAREADEYYRRTLLGDRSETTLLRGFDRAEHDLWPRLTWPRGAPPRFYPEAATREIDARFGAVVSLGRTAGYYDLHFGHRVEDEKRVVEQYGHRAAVRFVALDGIVSNGFQSWAWDGDGAHGGWQRGHTIFQVRPVYAEGTVFQWMVLADSGRRAAERRAIASDSAGDWRRAAVDSIAYLPGVAARLARDGREALLDSLRQCGLTGAQLQEAFMATYARVALESSIFAHEGRHAIDATLRSDWRPDELEFRAKLSEVAFAVSPRISMGAIIHPNIGDPTPHGRANARIMLGLVHWMRVHASEIRGLDPSLPMLPQLPRLTDDQLRAAFRGMDPLARG